MKCPLHRCPMSRDARGVLYCHVCQARCWAAEELPPAKPLPYMPWWEWVLILLVACTAAGALWLGLR